MRSLKSVALLLTTLACFTTTINAKQLTVYSWVDERGIAHFSYVEPDKAKGVRSFELKDHHSFGSDKRKLEGKNELSEDEEADPLVSRKKQYCENAKHNLSVLENYEQVTQQDAEGNEVTISGSEKEKRIKTAKQRIKAFCN